MQSLLFITPELPFPAQSGGKLKSFKLLEHLSSKFEVTLCCLLKEDDAQHLGEFRKAMPRIEIVAEPVCVKRNISNLVRSYARSEPLNVFRSASESLAQSVKDIAADYDVMFLDHYEVAQYVPEDFQGSLIYHGHNAYFKLWETYSKSRFNPLYKIATRLEAKRVKRYECDVANRADLVFAAHDDLKALRDAGVKQATMSETYHLGDETQLEFPAVDWYQTELALIYVGFLGWEANAAGLLWFIQHVWPTLLRKNPNLIFRIVGKGADSRLEKAVSKTKNIELLGYVDDVEALYRRSHLSIAPLTFGSGMKVKVLSAMARGIPVVTTPIGAESIRATHRSHLMISRRAGDMVNDINELFENKLLWNRLAIRSRKLIHEKYTWAKLFCSMDQAMEKLLATNAQVTASSQELVRRSEAESTQRSSQEDGSNLTEQSRESVA